MADFGDVLAQEALNGGPPVRDQAQQSYTVNGNTVLTYVQNGVRYAAIGAVAADAQNLLTNNPDFCDYT